MEMRNYLIAGGNSTLLVWGCPSNQKNKIISKYLGGFEQVGFVEETRANLPKLIMMGDELCINSTLSLASQLSNSGLLLTSGLTKPVRYKNINDNTSIELDLPFKKIENIVLLAGIGFICSNSEPKVSKRYLSRFAEKYNLPAFGVVFYKENKITPYVFVKKTDSLFKETACGSGSIACALITGSENIIQPTGETISVKIKGTKFTVGAKVVKIGESYE
ncbi:hypothetical protein M1437_02085 [Patescibacteria group bacterium]|nr:hypothetical protein [Patescibacteria group bacterium]